MSEYATAALPIIGSFTACLGAVSSAFQTDVKRLLAYSTISHCGFLVVSAILCDSEYTILYLYVHGFFKAASFICIGNVIRFNNGQQDLRHMGGFAKYLPFECYALFVCLLFLAGAPFTFGFFMKHYLLASISTIGIFNKILIILLFVAACLGVVYCSRLYYGIFFGSKKGSKHVYINVSKLLFYKKDTEGTFYTNATIGSAFAIFGLICSGLTISGILIIILFINSSNCADFGTFNNFTTIHELKAFVSLAALNNFGLLNIIMLILFGFICLVSFT
jgi:NADH:ubiquinone oxidoreductase subunit 5 (subunit L)/multisubunit Na+/H+ antiporter MnhA subunit